ncbi:MAG TPA: hypothetical protein VJO54_15180 [Burkholderiales bacterium]|nr:hypothetical protein [Burkholderiales bacterium]
MTHVTHSKMLVTRRRNQSRKKQLRRLAKQARRKTEKAKGAA